MRAEFTQRKTSGNPSPATLSKSHSEPELPSALSFFTHTSFGERRNIVIMKGETFCFVGMMSRKRPRGVMYIMILRASSLLVAGSFPSVFSLLLRHRLRKAKYCDYERWMVFFFVGMVPLRRSKQIISP